MADQQKEDLLAQLAPLQPPQVSLVPAHGWWLAIVGFALFGYLVYRGWRYYQSRHWQRQAFAELKRLRQRQAQSPVVETLSNASKLVRRIGLAAAPREEVAALQGQIWLEYLDSICERPTFTAGLGHLLEVGPYQRAPEVSEGDLNSLFNAVDTLIRAVGRDEGGVRGYTSRS